MKKEAQLFKSLDDETRLNMLWLLMGREELCVCDIMGVLGITHSKASRHRRYLCHLGWVTDRRDGLWMNYRLCVSPGSPGEKLPKLLEEILAPQPEAQALRGHLVNVAWRPNGTPGNAPRGLKFVQSGKEVGWQGFSGT